MRAYVELGEPDSVALSALKMLTLPQRANVRAKCLLVAMATCLAMMSVIPPLAAPRQVEDFCFEQSRHVRIYGRGGYEAFMANCIANLTPTPTGKRRHHKY